MQFLLPGVPHVFNDKLIYVDIEAFSNETSKEAVVVFSDRISAEKMRLSCYCVLPDELVHRMGKILFHYNYGDTTQTLTSQAPKSNASKPPEISVRRATLDNAGFNEVSVRHYENWKKCGDAYTVDYSGYAEYCNTELIKHDELNYLTQQVQIPETGILTLDDGIFSDRGVVYSGDMCNRFIELTRFGDVDSVIEDPQELQMYKSIQFHKPCGRNIKYLKGSCLNLSPLFANHNYCHSLLETSMMLDIVDSSGVALDSFDWFLLPIARYVVVDEIYKLSGIDKNKIIHGGRVKAEDGSIKPSSSGFLFDQLVTPSHGGFGAFYGSRHFNYVRELYRGDLNTSRKRRRLFLAREGAGRDLSNECELIDLLDNYGFDIVYASKQIDIPSLMASAAIVIGAHGAAMANCIFCSPGATLIDIMPAYYAKPYFMSLAYAVGMKYYGIFGKESASKTKETESLAVHAKRAFSVFIPQIKKLLDELC